MEIKQRGNADRALALARIVELADKHALELDDIAAALAGARSEHAPSAKTAVLTRLLAYLGALFVFAGLAVLIATQWDALGSAARVVITLGSGLACFAMAYVAAYDERFAAAVTPLYIVAAVLQPFGLLVLFDEYSAGGDWHYASLTTAGVLAAQQAVVFLRTRRSVLLFTAILFGTLFAATLLDLLHVDGEVIALTLGISVLCLAVGIRRTRHADITPVWFFAASASVLAGLFGVLEGTPVEPAFVAAACGMVYLSTYVRSRAVLIVAILGLLAYIGYFTAEHFVDTVGWPIGLIVFGFAMIGLSVAAVGISRRYIRGADDRTP